MKSSRTSRAIVHCYTSITINIHEPQHRTQVNTVTEGSLGESSHLNDDAEAGLTEKTVAKGERQRKGG